MIVLHHFGPKFGVPDPSPFCLKTLVMLKLSCLPFRSAVIDLRKAPKGKAPYIEDDSRIIADSTLIRFHLETHHGIDFDAGLGPAERGAAWAIEKLVEDNLYYALLRERWDDDANFKRGPVQYFDEVPGLLRPLVIGGVRRRVRKTLKLQGLGHHAPAEAAAISNRGIDALAQVLGDKPFLMGATPCGADATAFGWIANALSDVFVSPIGDHVRTHVNLVAYRDRGMARWF